MLEGMITETELLKVLGLKPSELAYLRTAKGMPFVRMAKGKRVYLEADLMEWFKNNRSSLDTDSQNGVRRPQTLEKYPITGVDDDFDTDVDEMAGKERKELTGLENDQK